MSTTNDNGPVVRTTQLQQCDPLPQLLSDEELKRYYLNEARMMCPTATEARSEKARLEILQVRVKRLIKLFSDLHNFQWNDVIKQMQIGNGLYLMDHNISAKERRKLNESWAQRLCIISEMRGYGDVIGHMLLHYTRQNRDLERILLTLPSDTCLLGGDTGEVKEMLN